MPYIFAPFLANYLLQRRILKRRSLLVLSQIVSGLIILLIGLFEADTTLIVVTLFFLSTFAGELVAILGWASIADCGDYSYYKDKVRITGILSGGMLFATKLGMAIGGALLGYILAFYDYDPNTASSANPDQLFAFVLLFSYLPAICLFLAGVVFSRYRLEADVCAKFAQVEHQ